MASADQTTSRSDGEQRLAAPSISLPKGGGTIRGMGEKFAANPVTGTGSLTVPLAISPGRAGFGPQLSLSYDSGAGNGPFDFGWNLAIPAITRKTDKGLPQYFDADESDVFILSGAEDLVPELRPDGSRFEDQETVPGYTIHRYRPRIEGLFARIERWTREADGDVHWRSFSKDNILTLYGYGQDDHARIVDPTDPSRVFSWLICETRDDKGNAVVYEYKPEDALQVDLTQAHERNRGDGNSPLRQVNRYIKHIRYGNRKSLLTPEGLRPRFLTEAALQSADWMFEVVFDYGEHQPNEPKPNDPGVWLCRHDPFSTYRAGFEVRTYRLCQRVLMFHHFPGEAGVGSDCLVRSTDFVYRDSRNHPDDRRQGHPIASFIAAVSQSGYTRAEAGGYLKKSLPPLEFAYSDAVIGQDIHDVDPASLENLPSGADGAEYQWVDLDGEGLSGVLTEQGGGWFYKRNESALTRDAVTEEYTARFAPVEPVVRIPAGSPLAGGHGQFLDLAGDGQVDVVAFEAPVAGFYERTDAQDWEPFRAFRSLPNLAWNDPNLKFIDLTGDGHADVLITEDQAFTWYPSLAEEGFGAATRISVPTDEERGPHVVFADGTQTISLADLSGDGLTDIVRIRNGEVCYWPNLGYGRFGAKVTMDAAPWFDTPEQFDPRRLRLADIDGSGVTDIIYLGRNRTNFWFNQSGNAWSATHELPGFPPVDNVASVAAVDLLGNGTACLVWSSPLPGASRAPMQYLNLMAKGKPHLLERTVNNLGAETRVHYAPSTYFYLQDKYAGKPWITKLPFPVHVVERVETFDAISQNRFVTRYAYHHGYFDGEEREFRGFGMVEQFDTEAFAALTADGTLPAATNVDEASHVPPVCTRTWFHTGIYVGRDHVSNFFAGLLDEHDQGEYYREPGLTDAQTQLCLLPDTVMPPGLTLEEEREACRALKGAMLRQEVYALDGTDKAEIPYTVTEQNFTIERLQPQDGNRHAVFFTHPREAINYHYERDPADPRISHALTLEVDTYGNVVKALAIGYGRRIASTDPAFTADDKAKQTRVLITYTDNRFTNAIDNVIQYPDDYRTRLPAETRTFELTGFQPENSAARFSFEEWTRNGFALLISAGEIRYEQAADDSTRQKRLIEHVRTLYRKDDLTALLQPGEVEPLALPGESYKLALTPNLLAHVFKRQQTGQPDEDLLPNPAPLLEGMGADQGGYVAIEGNWWIPTGRVFYSDNPNHNASEELIVAQGHFFLPRRYREPFGHDTVVSYDGPADPNARRYDLLITHTSDALGNTVHAQNDYRVLAPRVMTDPNGNRSEVAFDTLGMVAGTAVMGKEHEPDGHPKGDLLEENFAPDPTSAELDAFIAQPRRPSADPKESEVTEIVRDLLKNATTRIVYDLDRFRRLGEPPFAATIARETHMRDLDPTEQSKLQVSFSYSDGFGREIQKKIQAEPGPWPKRDADGKIIVGPDGQPEMTPNDVSPRWVGSGWTVFNNKGKPVRQYEPFFTDTHRFEFDVRIGVSPILFYDPVERVVATLHPNHTYEKVVFDPWQQTTYDVNDTVTLDPRTDEEVREFFSRLPDEVYLPTWNQLRTDSSFSNAFTKRYPDTTARANETSAAHKAAAHADTPSTAHFDALGRPFLTVARNRVVCADHPLNGKPDEEFRTRVELDIEGNQRKVFDERKLPDADNLPLGALEQRVVMEYAYDMLGNRIYQRSMEAGARWMLGDVAGKPICGWDSRGHNFTTKYDALRRPIEQTVRGTFSDPDPLKPNSDPRTLNRDILIDKIEYGEGVANAEALNLRTRIYRHSDSAGIATNARLDAASDPLDAYDFKGNLLRSTRQLVSDYTAIPDWLANPQLDAESFEGSTRYDALNRPIQSIAPHSNLTHPGHPNKFNIIQPVFNEANLLERVDVWLERAAEPPGLLDPANDAPSPVGVADIDYDAKGQRLRIDYKNGSTTRYRYDPETFRLVHLYTRRGAAFTEDCDNPTPPPPTIAAPDTPPQGKSCGLQNLHYTYDPVGNITHIRDDAQQTIYFKNKRVEPSNDYVYDALYRLIQADGREHLGQVGGAPIPHSHDDAGRVGLLSTDAAGRFAASDGNAMGTYIERYMYDAVGNFLQMQHRGTDPVHPGWTRRYTYNEPSLIEGGKQSNRLSSTQVGNGITAAPETYLHDAHGNMLRMAHLGGGLPGPNMQWDYKDHMSQTDLGGGGTAFYVYDASGQRVRKVWEKAPGLTEERIYLGGFEVFRKRNSAGTVTLERETLHVMDDKQRIALVETRTQGNDGYPSQLIRYQLSNHLGSASLELDDQAQIISYEEYFPYGSTSYQAVRSGLEANPKHYRYTGMERDEETGFSYHEARYYSAWLGRWISTDPAGFVSGHDLYCYVGDNPLQYTDPTGMGPLDSEIYRKEREEALERQQAELENQHSKSIFAELDTNHNGQIDAPDIVSWAECWDRKALYTRLKQFLNVTNEHYFGPGAYWSALTYYSQEYSGSARAYNLAHKQWDIQDPSNRYYTDEEQTEIDTRRYQARLLFANYVLGELIPSMGGGEAIEGKGSVEPYGGKELVGGSSLAPMNTKMSGGMGGGGGGIGGEGGPGGVSRPFTTEAPVITGGNPHAPATSRGPFNARNVSQGGNVNCSECVVNFEASAQAGGRVRVQIPGGGAPATMTAHVSRLRGVGANPRVLPVTYSNQMGVTNALGRYPPGTRFSVWANRGAGQIGHVFGGQIDSSGAVRFLETQVYTSINWGGYSSFNIIIH